MRWSRYYLHTTREVPSDAEIVSHRLMTRAGMIKKVAAGIYTYQPLGWRSIAKLMEIVRLEMNRAGAIELQMPATQPAALWQESGRWDVYGKDLLRMKDRHDRDFCLGPTHEEVITDLVRGDVKSYRQLPFTLYQIQAKFRDEIRPRFGLMRGREFLMKDAYSFHTSEASLEETYEAVGQAYCRTFESCGLRYSKVEADSGAIGGSLSHEFMVLADTGESAVVSCQQCGYAANTEKAEAGITAGAEPEPVADLEPVATPGMTSIADVSAFLAVPPERLLKTLIFESEIGLVAVALRGDHELNEIKLRNVLGVQQLALAGDREVERVSGAPVGFAGPVGLPKELPLLADAATRDLRNFVCGANAIDQHLVGVNWARDAEPSQWVDVRLVAGGDACPRCMTPMALSRGIEVGHTFMLGTKYSQPMGCVFTDETGNTHPMIMGCYGLGIGRTVAAAIEQNHDEKGIIWPVALAPFQVLVVALNPDDEAVRAESERLYKELLERGFEVLFDDRNERPGVKFNDADLVGIPVRLVVGARSLAAGHVEISRRSDRERQELAPGDAAARIGGLLGG